LPPTENWAAELSAGRAGCRLPGGAAEPGPGARAWAALVATGVLARVPDAHVQPEPAGMGRP
jgi:hypothetical protein